MGRATTATERGTAALFVGTGRPFELRAYRVPDPGPGEAVVRILQANVCGSDLHMWRGELDLERLRLPLPAVLGHEAVGEVVGLGSGAERDAAGAPLAPGDRVVWRYFTPCGRCRSCVAGVTRACADNHRFISQWRSADDPPHFVGPFATHIVLPPGHVAYRVPDGVSDQAAAAANCALSEVLQALHTAGLRAGETFVVQGAGGLGLYACAVARSLGAGRIVVVDSIAERLDLAREFGADAVVDGSALPDPRDRVAAVKDATDGWGGDVVGEFVGHASAVAEGIRMVAPAGRYLEVGCIHAGTTFELDPAHLTLFNRSLVSVVYYEPEALGEALAFLERTRDALPWERLFARRYPLEAIGEAFDDADGRRVPRAALIPA
jgi:threonine dehydrogenase-like Zn-dependent dehydrogenase